MKFRTLAALSIAAVATALASAPASADHRRGHTVETTVTVTPGRTYAPPRVYVAPAPVYVAPAPVYVAPAPIERKSVITRDYGNCTVRNVTTVDANGRRVQRRTKTC